MSKMATQRSTITDYIFVEMNDLASLYVEVWHVNTSSCWALAQAAWTDIIYLQLERWQTKTHTVTHSYEHKLIRY